MATTAVYLMNPLINYFSIENDPLAFLLKVMKEAGDFSQFRILNFNYYFVNDPDLIREALVAKPDQFIIKGGVSRGLSRLIGHGILTNHGEDWRQSRNSLNALFASDNLKNSDSIMRARVDESLERWKNLVYPFPFNREILALSFRIMSSTLFAYIPTFAEAEVFANAIWTLQHDGMKRFMSGLDLIDWLPVPINRKVNAARAELYNLAHKMVDCGAKISQEEILSLLFAGTESPANTICYALKLLQDYPDVRTEIASQSDIENSPAMIRFISEVLRLYPAGWAFERYACKNTSLGDKKIPKGSRLLFSPYVLHRNPRFWKEPEKFDPRRSIENIPKFAYLPFGAGPRSCIGSRLAWQEMQVILGQVILHCQWKIDHPEAVTAKGSFKIRLGQPMTGHLDVRSYAQP